MRRFGAVVALGTLGGGWVGFGAGLATQQRSTVNVVSLALAENEATRHSRDSLYFATHQCGTLLTSPLRATIRGEK